MFDIDFSELRISFSFVSGSKSCHSEYLILEREDEPVIQQHSRSVPALGLRVLQQRAVISIENVSRDVFDFYANMHKVGHSTSLSRDIQMVLELYCLIQIF